MTAESARIPGWRTAWISLGALVLVVGAIAAAAARSAADAAAYVASQPTRLISDPSNPIGIEFDPTSAHHVGADYTLFWIWVAVAAVGAVLVLTMVLAGRTARRTPLASP
jgi:hypothetical protein